MDLGETLDKIIHYETICEKYKFGLTGSGTVPWSHCYKNEDGNSIDIAGNKWVLYDIDGDSIDKGYTPDELQLSLKLIYG